MDRLVFLKCPPLFPLSLSLFLSRSHRLSSFPHTSRAFISFLYLAMYAFVSPVNSFVILRFSSPFPSSPYHLRARTPFSSSPTTSPIRSSHLSCVPACSSLCFSNSYARISPSFSFCASVFLYVPLLFPSRVRHVFFGRCNAFPAVIYPCAAPLNYARNYAYSERVSTSEMQTVHPGKCISWRRGESGDQDCRIRPAVGAFVFSLSFFFSPHRRC